VIIPPKNAAAKLTASPFPGACDVRRFIFGYCTSEATPRLGVG